jgi:hypothetical protein
MFRRLAEAFQTSDSSIASDYIANQQAYYGSLPNMIPSLSSGLNGFDKAIGIANVYTQKTELPINFPNQIFRKEISPNLGSLANKCASSSLDDLITEQNSGNSSDAIRCGWMYSPPVRGSRTPALSKGVIGTAERPLPGFNDGPYKTWYFNDLRLAKQQIQTDHCRTLTNCNDVDSYNSACGYCTDSNQGVPIDKQGKPLYSGINGCSPASIVRSSGSCPPPPPIASQIAPIRTNDTCIAVNGRLSADCLYKKVIEGGCKDDGSLAVALQTNFSNKSQNYIGTLADSDAVKIYNRVTNNAFNISMFGTGGNTTIETVLQQVGQLSMNASQPKTSPLGASARELCLQAGSIQDYDPCTELSGGSTPPFDMKCLQRLFIKMGGQNTGLQYPSNKTSAIYNSMNTYNDVIQFINQLVADTNNPDYNTQRTAMMNLLGITPETLIVRPPYHQGIEVFWFAPVRGNPLQNAGFLKRTIERDFIQYQNRWSSYPQIGGAGSASFMQMTDIRSQTDYSVNFNVVVDDGFFISVNQPSDIDKSAFAYGSGTRDIPGLFQNLGMQGATRYISNACTKLNSFTPNIAKIYYEDAGGGGSCFLFNTQICGQTPANTPSPFTMQNYSLSCEAHAPFLTFEVNPKTSLFEELRNPGLFSHFTSSSGLTLHTRTDERSFVPGGKPYASMTNSSSSINLSNIAFQSWKTFTVAIRLQSIPVGNESVIHMVMGAMKYANVIIGRSGKISIKHNFNGSDTTVDTSFVVSVNSWYLFVVSNKMTSFEFKCISVDNPINGNPIIISSKKGALYNYNAIQSPHGPVNEICGIAVGTNGLAGAGWSGVTGTSQFNYDVAWCHFFDRFLSDSDLKRECFADWIYTQFPQSYNTF